MTENPTHVTHVNNDIYATLGERWYSAEDDPVALLRAESRLRNPWVAQEIRRKLGVSSADILDVGCGGGLLANFLGSLGHRVTGLDASNDALAVAARHDFGQTVHYQQGDALRLPFADATFDVVCAMDFLEHVENPEQAIAEAARVLRPSGLFFFHTFNRNLLCWLVVIKGVEWFVRNTPQRMHILRLFLKPAEVIAWCAERGLHSVQVRGTRPQFGWAFFKMLFTRRVSAEFSFAFTPSTRLGYSGVATKTSAEPDA